MNLKKLVATERNISILLLPFIFFYIKTVTASDRPNIIIIMADDMGFSDIGCYGGEISTPNLDKLAGNGIRFTQFYNAARCCPTRASLLTGLYPHQAGIGDMTNDMGEPSYRGDLNNQCITVAEALKMSGYRTFMSGKWHVTKHVDYWRTWLSEDQKVLTSKHNWPRQRGFDEFFGTIHGAGSYYNPSTLTKNNTPIEAWEDFYYTDAITSGAVDFIRNNSEKNNDKPFFGYIAYTAPHWPLHALPEDIQKYKGKYNSGWDKIRETRMSRMIEMELISREWELSNRDTEIVAWEDSKNKEWWAACMEVYAAMIDRMDQGIGIIIKALEETGQLENTLILFLADNGGCAEVLTDRWPPSLHFPVNQKNGKPLIRGNDVSVLPGADSTYMSYSREWANVSNTPFRLYKHFIHEGGISTPLIAYWPAGIKSPGKITSQFGHIIDIMPTCLEVAGAVYPAKYNGEVIKPLEGQSLAPVFENKTFSHHPIGWEHGGNKGYREGNWKLVSNGGDWELYNMEKDRTELNNLAAVYPEKKVELIVKYSQWANRVGVINWNERREKK